MDEDGGDLPNSEAKGLDIRGALAGLGGVDDDAPGRGGSGGFEGWDRGGRGKETNPGRENDGKKCGMFGTNGKGSGGSNVSAADCESGFKISQKGLEVTGSVDCIVRDPLDVAISVSLQINVDICALVY